MGYNTHVTGEFTITPPLTWPEIKDTPYISDDWRDSDLVLRLNEQLIDTDEGPLIRRSAATLAMREIDEYRAHGLVETVQKAIDAFPGHTFTGRLNCEGEETGDLWRVEVHDGRATKVEPRIVWPGEEVASAAAISVELLAERAYRHGNQLDPEDVYEALGLPLPQ